MKYASEWKGKHVVVLGLGQYTKGSGVAAALFFARAGADLLVSDFYFTKTMATNVAQLKKFKNVRFLFNKHPIKEVASAELVVKHQRMRSSEPEIREALKRNIPIETAESLFLKLCPCPVIGITGTRGKSTTTTLVYEMLRQGKRKVWLGGNILVSPLTFLHRIKPDDLVVLELSSFQLEGTGAAGISPHIACVTNVMRDHLNAYGSMEEYTEAKAQIFRHQNADDVVVLNGDDADGKRWTKEAPGRVAVFSKKQKLPTSFSLPGEHNRMNALAAVLAARSAGASASAITKTLKTFKGLKDRQEIVAVKKGITYVNDSTATTPDGAIAALKVFREKARKLHVIIGGSDKKLEFDGFAKELKASRADIVVLPGTAHAKLTASLKKQRVAYTDVKTLKEGVHSLRSRAQKGDVILLSPGCASFGMFKNEFDRGEQFHRLITRL